MRASNASGTPFNSCAASHATNAMRSAMGRASPFIHASLRSNIMSTIDESSLPRFIRSTILYCSSMASFRGM